MSEIDALNRNQLELLKKLQSVGSDFWGEEVDGGEAVPKKSEKPGSKAQLASGLENRPVGTRIDLNRLWMNADETIDWTDALAHEKPADGLTPPGLWQYFHQEAEKVLQGDINAYAEVLKRINPLGDLTPYADRITLRAPNPERLECSFQCKKKMMEDAPRKYLSALGLRIARDLLACLPVSEIGVTACEGDEVRMQVTYPRGALLKKNFRFVDPVKEAERCGAVFTGV